MLILSAVLRVFSSQVNDRIPRIRSVESEPTAAMHAEADEQAFRLSVAHLAPDEQQRQLQKRAFYQRLAQRQGLMEAESRSDDHWRSDSTH